MLQANICFENGIVSATSENIEGVALRITDKSSCRATEMLMKYGGLSLLFKIPLKVLYGMKAYDKYTPFPELDRKGIPCYL